MLNGFLLSTKSQTKKKETKKKEKTPKNSEKKVFSSEGFEPLINRSKDHHSAIELPSQSHKIPGMMAIMNPIWPPKM